MRTATYTIVTETYGPDGELLNMTASEPKISQIIARSVASDMVENNVVSCAWVVRDKDAEILHSFMPGDFVS